MLRLFLSRFSQRLIFLLGSLDGHWQQRKFFCYGEGGGWERGIVVQQWRKKEKRRMRWNGKNLCNNQRIPPFSFIVLGIYSVWEERKGQEDAALQKFFSLSRGQRLLFPFFPGYLMSFKTSEAGFFDDKSLRITSRSRFLFLASTTTHTRTKGG